MACYCISALGEPLIKGLTEVSNQRPKDPISFLATYLYNFANKNKDRIKTQVNSTIVTLFNYASSYKPNFISII